MDNSQWNKKSVKLIDAWKPVMHFLHTKRVYPKSSTHISYYIISKQIVIHWRIFDVNVTIEFIVYWLLFYKCRAHKNNIYFDII